MYKEEQNEVIDTYSDDIYSDDIYSGDTYSDDAYSDDAYSDDTYSDDAYSDDAYSDDNCADDIYANDTNVSGCCADDIYVNDDNTEDNCVDDNIVDNSDIADNKMDNTDTDADTDNERNKLSIELKAKEKMYDELLDRFQRLMAEFDNYKKRTQKEKESAYEYAASDTISAFLPVVDSIERAAAAASVLDDDSEGSIKEGVNLIEKQANEVLNKLKVERIPGEGANFDPLYHDAVMHIEDESLEKNVVAEVFQVGYLYKGKVVRYSMVKVAN